MPRLRDAVTAVVVVGALLGIISTGHAMATLPADVEIEDVGCTNESVSALTLSVAYAGDEPVTVTPHVWSQKQHVQFTWTPETIRLHPGEQTVEIHTTDSRAWIHGDVAQVWLADGQQRSITNFEVDGCS